MKGYYLMPHPPIIVPEVGKGNEREVNITINSCKSIGDKIKNLDIDTIIIISPHGPVFQDGVSIITSKYISGNLGSFGASDVEFKYEVNTPLCNKIMENAFEKSIGVASLDEFTTSQYNIPLQLDHGAMVPLYYIGRNYKLVNITYGLITPLELAQFGKCIKDAVDEIDCSAVIIASGDLSHRLKHGGPYTYSPSGKEFDDMIVSILEKGNLKELFNIDRKLIQEAGECGLRSLYILAGSLNSLNTNTNVLSYEGPFGVGYAIMDFNPNDNKLLDILNEEKHSNYIKRLNEVNIYTKLARYSLDYYFNKGKMLDIQEAINLIKNDDISNLLNDRKGVLVSLKINGDLRGCIGTIQPTTSCVGEEIIKNTLSAALNDPRFTPLRKSELLDIDISVDLLNDPEISTFDKLDVVNYGVIVTSGNKRGLLLPNLEGVNTPTQQVDIALQKGNISKNEDYILERFKVERFSEK